MQNNLINDWVHISTSQIDSDLININTLAESQILKIDRDILNTLTSDNSMILFDAAKFLKNIMESYKMDTNKIQYQFDVDFHRSKLICNKTVIPDIVSALNKFKSCSKYELNLCDKIFGMDTILMMLCTQASFAFSFSLMHQMYCDQAKHIFVTSNNHKYKMTINNESINIELDANFNLKNIQKNTNLKGINIQTNIDFVYKNPQYELCKFGIISWNVS
jgi:hypothetical protein